MSRNVTRLPLPSKNERWYLMNQVVIVISLSLWFDLVKVRYENESKEFFVDIRLLRLKPDSTPTISLDLLGGAP